jgi:hypothetical protein
MKINKVEVNKSYALPESDGSAGQVLSTDGAGGMSWSAAASGGGRFY